MAASAVTNPSMGRRLVRPLISQSLFLVCAAVVGAAVWYVARSADAPPSSTADPAAALIVYLEQTEGLTADEGQLVYLEPPTERDWVDGLGYVPAFGLLKSRHEGVGDDLEDLYYMEVRTTSAGAPLEVRRLANITNTPHARERLVMQEGESALLAVEVFSQIQSMLMVDFTGDERELPTFEKKGDRLRYEITNLQETGRRKGIGTRLYRIDPPASKVEAVWRDGRYVATFSPLKTTPDVPMASLAFDPATGAVELGEHEGRAEYLPRFYAAKGFTPWLVDTVRGLSFVGPKKIAALEKFVFEWADKMKQAAFAMGLISETEQLMAEIGGAENTPSAASIEALKASASDEWPPPDVKAGVDDPKEGEGKWQPVEIDWLRTLPGAPPAFLKTAVRMDPQRPYSTLVLIAIDMRQLDMNMVAGTITPEPSFGTRGDGLIPREPEVLDRLVAACNGGFKTAHGAFGMMVDRTVILPAMPYAATIAVQDDGTIEMGSWNNSMNQPERFRSFRQNLPPLMADGKFNPTRKRKWGGTASDLDNVNTTRSGMCFRGEHTLVYVWGRDTSADAMGAAMLAVGCDYGMHLDMNPTHTGWSYYRTSMDAVGDKNRIRDYKVEKGSPNMDFDEGRYINRDVKDLFYFTLRRTFVEELPEPPEGFMPWATTGVPTTAEGFLPALSHSTGQREGEVVVAVDLSQTRAKLRRGIDEPDPTEALGTTNEAPAAIKLENPALVVDLGVTTLERPHGFVADGKIFAPLVPGQPVLARSDAGRLVVVDAKTAQGFDRRTWGNLRGGDPLVVDGEVIAKDDGVGELTAVGMDDEERLFVAVGKRRSRQFMARLLAGLGARYALAFAGTPNQRPRVRYLDVAGEGVEEIDIATGKRSALATERAVSTHLFVEITQRDDRVKRLELEDVELGPDEAKRQRRLLAQIKAMREELRNVENAKYKVWIEKIRAEREAKKQK